MSYILKCSIAYAMSISGYFIQKLSDLWWTDSVTISTNLSQIASIRHHRASDMIGTKIYNEIMVSLSTVRFFDIEGIDEISPIFWKNENILYNTFHSMIPEDINDKYYKEIKSHYNMIMLTQNCIAKLLSFNKYDSELIDDYYYKYNICFQCGETYYDKESENITECEWCGAGLNHIVYVLDLQ